MTVVTVSYDLSPAEVDSKIRTKLVEMGWTPPGEKSVQTKMAALVAFRSAVTGWRENDWPEWFCRRTAEAVADRGRQAEGGEA